MTKSHTDRFYLTSLNTHLKWIFGDYHKGEVYGIPESLFFRPGTKDPFRMSRYGQLLETPIGVAAGPQTQLVQTLVSAWLTGSRYLELETIQVLDLYVYNISTSKPPVYSVATALSMLKSLVSLALLFGANTASKLIRKESIV
mgnify:CR=1 FL=1